MFDLFRDVPLEIWHRIFLEGVGDELVSLTHRRNEPPWLYLKVCKRWRAMAEQHHILWTGVAVKVAYRTSDEQLTALHRLLSWSSPYPLSLDIDSSWSMSVNRPVWDMLRKERFRCTKMKLQCLHQGVKVIQLKTWIALTALDIEFVPSPPIRTGSFPLELTELDALQSYTERSRGNIRISVYLPSQVQEVALHARGSWLHTVLQDSPCLTKLLVHSDTAITWPVGRLAFNDPRFPRLRDVTLINAEPWLEALEDTALESLAFHNYHPLHPMSSLPAYLPLLTRLLQRSRDELELLDLKGKISWSDTALLRAVTHLSRLQSLHLEIEAIPLLMDPTTRAVVPLLPTGLLSWITTIKEPGQFPHLQRVLFHCRVVGHTWYPDNLQETLEKSPLLQYLIDTLIQADANHPGCGSELHVHFGVGQFLHPQHWRWGCADTRPHWQLIP